MAQRQFLKRGFVDLRFFVPFVCKSCRFAADLGTATIFVTEQFEGKVFGVERFFAVNFAPEPFWSFASSFGILSGMVNSASKNVEGNIAAGGRQGDGLAVDGRQGNGSAVGGRQEGGSTSGGRRRNGSVSAKRRREFRLGLRRSVPVALGYFAVAFTFGIFCTKNGLPPLAAALLSLTNLSSTGQFVGVEIFGRLGSLFEMGLAVLVVNLRYLLMSFVLTQRLDPRVGIGQRLFLAWGVTDEIFALGLLERPLTFAYYAGLMPLPILGWSSGTMLGALLGQVLPASIQSAFGIALYAMFIAIVVPPTKSSRPLQIIVAL